MFAPTSLNQTLKQKVPLPGQRESAEETGAVFLADLI